MRTGVGSTGSPTIGDTLRVARLDRRLSLEETAWRTRMRPDLLRALEEDSYDTLGHEAFVRSHLTSYARFLGIDSTALVRRFDASRPTPSPSSLAELERAAREARKPPRARWMLAAALSALVLVAATAVGVIGGQAERVAAEVPEPAVAAQSGPVPVDQARVHLTLRALADTHVHVLADGVERFEGVVREGTVRRFRAREALELIAANGAAIALVLNGEDLGAAGADGEVFRRAYGPDGPLGPA